ncbi:hypothetical protein [Shewanella sp. NIFS-20-20]|uniref:hypothetical protein n=1 Tax=Shewanella sp. NIFS-20-20 TaxID=2853806 RepID=UPI001C43F8EE|nr:hypothetical protein [Shewanella sp. NIFS-20-20]MBV7315456.1 hypothetical protein [Shewanella sp. NIFS-20-20]
MASKIVPVVGNDWTELSAAPKGCFENQCSAPLIYWVSDVAPLSTQVIGHSLSTGHDKGFQIDDTLSMKLWARTLSTNGNVIVTEY